MRAWIGALKGTRDIKAITGMRRSGKSGLMKAFSSSVARKDPSANNVYIDLLDLDCEPLLEYHALHREIMERHKEGARNCLFIDEVQLCGGFEKAINSIHARGGWDIYLTGSNAFLPSSDLATLLTGRHREVHILPFSFGEYRSYFDEPSDAAGLPGPTITTASRSCTAIPATSAAFSRLRRHPESQCSEGSSEAPGNLIATLSGAKRRVGGQQNGLCVPFFGLWFRANHVTRHFTDGETTTGSSGGELSRLSRSKRRTSRSFVHELGVLLPGGVLISCLPGPAAIRRGEARRVNRSHTSGTAQMRLLSYLPFTRLPRL